jgi:hypothetical protein
LSTTSGHAPIAARRPIIAALRPVLGDAGWAYGFILAYFLFVTFVAIALGRPGNAPAAVYLGQWIGFPLATGAAYLVFAFLVSLATPSPMERFRKRLALLSSPQTLSRLALFVLLWMFHGMFTSMKGMLSAIAPFRWDPDLAEWDRVLHGADPWTLIPQSEAFTRVLQFLYLPGWLMMLMAVNIWVCFFAAPALRQQFLKTYLFAWVVLGNVAALAFMSAGPVYYEHVTGSARFAPILHYLEFSRGLPYSNLLAVDYLWANYASGGAQMGSGISAFPSLHLAMATLWACTFWHVAPRLRALLVGFVVLIQIGSVHLGWHYAIDGYASILATLAAWTAFGWRKRGAETA